jgi:hypothetical protein
MPENLSDPVLMMSFNVMRFIYDSLKDFDTVFSDQTLANIEIAG